MTPLDLVPRWVWATLVVMLAATSCKLKLDNSGLSIEIEKGKTHVTQLKTAIATANSLASDQRIRFESQAREAEAATRSRERVLAADAGAARTELDRLRATVASARSDYSLRANAAALAPSLDTADIFPELFLQCSSRLVEVAGEADQWRSDAIRLHDSWPVAVADRKATETVGNNSFTKNSGNPHGYSLETGIVIPVVVGSSPISHPTSPHEIRKACYGNYSRLFLDLHTFTSFSRVAVAALRYRLGGIGLAVGANSADLRGTTIFRSACSAGLDSLPQRLGL